MPDGIFSYSIFRFAYSIIIFAISIFVFPYSIFILAHSIFEKSKVNGVKDDFFYTSCFTSP